MEVARSGLVLTFSTALILTALSGCMDYGTDDNGGGDDSGEGNVAFYVKDAPSDDFVSVFVTFTEVKVHRAGGDGDDDGLTTVPNDDLSTVPDDDLSTVPDDDLSTVPDDDLGDDGSGAGWFTIVDSEHTIDLKQFQGDARAFLGNAAIDAGKYTQIRIIVSDVWGENATGDRTDFDLPSHTLKIVRPWTVGDGETTTLTVDFDLEQSIHKKGQDGYSMKPVLKLTIENGTSDAAENDASDETDETNEANGGGKPTDKTKPVNTHKP